MTLVSALSSKSVEVLVPFRGFTDTEVPALLQRIGLVSWRILNKLVVVRLRLVLAVDVLVSLSDIWAM